MWITLWTFLASSVYATDWAILSWQNIFRYIRNKIVINPVQEWGLESQQIRCWLWDIPRISQSQVYKRIYESLVCKCWKVFAWRKRSWFWKCSTNLGGKIQIVHRRTKSTWGRQGNNPRRGKCSLSEIWASFQLDDGAFESKYGFAKTWFQQAGCLSGKGARMASDKLTLLNDENVHIYKERFNERKARGLRSSSGSGWRMGNGERVHQFFSTFKHFLSAQF